MSVDLKRHFEATGYVVLRGLLTTNEAARYRSLISSLSGVRDTDFLTRVFECPDGVSKNREFWDLIWNQSLLSTLREILGSNVRYTQHSDLHAHRTGGWHRDCACRKYNVGPDWDETVDPYKVVRVAIYLQSFAESGSSLGVVPGSNRFERQLTDSEWRRWVVHYQKASLWQRVKRKLGLWKTPALPERCMTMWTDPLCDTESATPSFPVWIKTEPGDVIIFDQRLYHSASTIRGPKYAVYLSYSPENQHAVNHMGYYRHFRKDLGYQDLDPELAELLKAKSLYMAAPPPDKVDGYFANGAQIV